MTLATAVPAACAAVAAAVSARWNWWRPTARGLPALMYHKIGDAPAGSRLKKLWVSARDFRWQMEYLVRHGFTPVLFSELAGAREKPLPEKPVLVTLDDGYANNYETAFPVLQELKVKANIFLVVETLGRHNAWHDPSAEPWLDMMDLAQAERMQESGLVEFGSHTMGHRNLAAIPLEEARWELRESKKRLEEMLRRPVSAFAYPYGSGAFVPEVRAAALEAEYLHDFSVRQGVAPWPWEPGLGPIPRLLIRGDDNRFDFHLNLTRGKSRF